MSARRYRIVYEDDAIIVVDKPSGMLVIPTPKGETNTLTDLLNRGLDDRGVGVNAYPCHRIDRETSGLIIYAKGKAAQKRVMEQFHLKRVTKRYIAIVHGRVKKDFDTITISIYNRKKRRAEPAVTKYRVLGRGGAYTPQPEGHASKDMEEWPSGGIQLRGKRNPEKKEAAAVGPRSFTVLEVETLTGRTNQIRVHMAAAGHPLVGESVYSFRKDFALRFKRAALHASHIGFAHPATGKPVSFDSPLPEDMKTFFGLR